MTANVKKGVKIGKKEEKERKERLKEENKEIHTVFPHIVSSLE
jgi:hypothetical protein